LKIENRKHTENKITIEVKGKKTWKHNGYVIWFEYTHIITFIHSLKSMFLEDY